MGQKQHQLSLPKSFLLFIFVAIWRKSSLKYYEAQSVITCQLSPMRNICSAAYVYLYYCKLVCSLSLSPLPYFASLPQFFVQTAEPGKRGTCTSYSACIVSLLGPRAPSVRSPSLACRSRQGKLCSAKCLQTFSPLFLPSVIFKMYLFPRSLSGAEGSAKCIQHTPSSQIRAFLPPLRCSTCFKTKEPWA